MKYENAAAAGSVPVASTVPASLLPDGGNGRFAGTELGDVMFIEPALALISFLILPTYVRLGRQDVREPLDPISPGLGPGFSWTLGYSHVRSAFPQTAQTGNARSLHRLYQKPIPAAEHSASSPFDFAAVRVITKRLAQFLNRVRNWKAEPTAYNTSRPAPTGCPGLRRASLELCAIPKTREGTED